MSFPCITLMTAANNAQKMDSIFPFCRGDKQTLPQPPSCDLFMCTGLGLYAPQPLGRAQRGSYCLPSKRLLGSPLLAPLLGTLLRTLPPSKTDCKTPSKNHPETPMMSRPWGQRMRLRSVLRQTRRNRQTTANCLSFVTKLSEFPAQVMFSSVSPAVGACCSL